MYVRAAEEHGVAVTEAQLGSAELDDAWAQLGHATRPGPQQRIESMRQRSPRCAVRSRTGPVPRRRCRLHRRSARPDHDPRRGPRGSRRPVHDLRRHACRLSSGSGTFRRAVVDRLEPRLATPGDHPCARRQRPLSKVSLTSARIGVRKPHPKIFEAAMRARRHRACNETIYVGDSYKHDVLGARNVGMDAILIDRDASYRWPATRCHRHPHAR